MFEQAHFKTDMRLHLMEMPIALDELQSADPENQLSIATMGLGPSQEFKLDRKVSRAWPRQTWREIEFSRGAPL